MSRQDSERSSNLPRDTWQGTGWHSQACPTPNSRPSVGRAVSCSLGVSSPCLESSTAGDKEVALHPRTSREGQGTASLSVLCPAWSKPLERQAPAQSPQSWFIF